MEKREEAENIKKVREKVRRILSSGELRHRRTARMNDIFNVRRITSSIC